MAEAQQVARTMAREALTVAVSDATAARARLLAIGRGLLGAVLNALEKGVLQNEIVEMLGEAGLESLRAALSSFPNAVTILQRDEILRLTATSREATMGCGSHG